MFIEILISVSLSLLFWKWMQLMYFQWITEIKYTDVTTFLKWVFFHMINFVILLLLIIIVKNILENPNNSSMFAL